MSTKYNNEYQQREYNAIHAPTDGSLMQIKDKVNEKLEEVFPKISKKQQIIDGDSNKRTERSENDPTIRNHTKFSLIEM